MARNEEEWIFLPILKFCFAIIVFPARILREFIGWRQTQKVPKCLIQATWSTRRCYVAIGHGALSLHLPIQGQFPCDSNALYLCNYWLHPFNSQRNSGLHDKVCDHSPKGSLLCINDKSHHKWQHCFNFLKQAVWKWDGLPSHPFLPKASGSCKKQINKQKQQQQQISNKTSVKD